MIDGNEFVNEDHIVGPFPIERTVKVEKPALDDEGKPVLEDGKPTTEIVLEQKVYGIYAQPIWSYDEFDEALPFPTAPTGSANVFTKKGKSKDKPKRDLKDPQYVADKEQWYEAREGWTLLKSLEPSNIVNLPLGVSLADPKTWHRGTAALQKFFSHYEYNAIMKMIDRACGIDMEKVAENRESFLLQRRQKSSAPTSPTNS